MMITNANTHFPEIGQIVTVRQRGYIVLGCTEAPELVPPTSKADIDGWDRCKILTFGKNLIGFSIPDHAQTSHQGKDLGYRKVRDKMDSHTPISCSTFG